MKPYTMPLPNYQKRVFDQTRNTKTSSMIQIIRGRNEWDELILNCKNSDSYHTFDYHQLSNSRNEEPILIKYRSNGITIGIPLMLREIPGTAYKDASSAYGYLGPVSNGISDDFDNTGFARELQSFFLKNNIISVFSRLNPFVQNQELCLKGLGKISTAGKVVNIDITKNLDEQRRQYNKRLKTYINKSLRTCTISQAQTQAEIDRFIALYYENMKRVDAEEHYFFDEVYFYNLLASTSFKTDILLATENEGGKVIGGAMFIEKNGIAHYHLAGSKKEYLHLNPIKLLIDAMSRKATLENRKYLNLGGGVGSKEDSLFFFKSSFSKDFKPFKVWKYIVNEKVYEELVRKKEYSKSTDDKDIKSSFFPLYRI